MYIISQYNSQKKRFKLFVGATESHAEDHGRNAVDIYSEKWKD